MKIATKEETGHPIKIRTLGGGLAGVGGARGGMYTAENEIPVWTMLVVLNTVTDTWKLQLPWMVTLPTAFTTNPRLAKAVVSVPEKVARPEVVFIYATSVQSDVPSGIEQHELDFNEAVPMLPAVPCKARLTLKTMALAVKFLTSASAENIENKGCWFMAR